MWKFGRMVRKPHLFEMFLHGFLQELPLYAADFQAEGDVLPDSAPGKERRVLKDHPTVRSWTMNFFAPKKNLSFGWGYESGNKVEQCGFAAATWSQHTDKLSFPNSEAQISEHRRQCCFTAMIPFVNRIKNDHHGSACLPRRSFIRLSIHPNSTCSQSRPIQQMTTMQANEDA